MHDNDLINNYLWTTICKSQSLLMEDMFVLKSFLCIIVVLLICSMIEIGRQNVFKIIKK